MLPIIKQQKDAQSKLGKIANDLITAIEDNAYINLVETLAKQLETMIANTDLKNIEAEQIGEIFKAKLQEKQRNAPSDYVKMLWSDQYYLPIINLFIARHNSRIKQMEFKKEMELYSE